jgi:hypothetical protein
MALVKKQGEIVFFPLDLCLCPFMCLPVSRLFWVSSLAYPNLLGTKMLCCCCCCCCCCLWTCVPPLHKAETSNHLHLWIFKHFKLTTLMHKQSRKQNLPPEKEKDHASRNMLILMEQHHNAVCRIWSPTFRLLVLMHFPQFVC